MSFALSFKDGESISLGKEGEKELCKEGRARGVTSRRLSLVAGARSDFQLDFNPEGMPRAGYSRRGRH